MSIEATLKNLSALARVYPRYPKVVCLVGRRQNCLKAKGFLKRQF